MRATVSGILKRRWCEGERKLPARLMGKPLAKPSPGSPFRFQRRGGSIVEIQPIIFVLTLSADYYRFFTPTAVYELETFPEDSNA